MRQAAREGGQETAKLLAALNVPWESLRTASCCNLQWSEDVSVMKVFVAQHPTEAHFLKGLLESHGIPSEVRGEALFGVRGDIPFTEALPEVWVLNDDQLGEALNVLRNRSRESDEVGELQSWRCSNCDETLESQFTTCWSCNADRPNPSELR